MEVVGESWSKLSTVASSVNRIRRRQGLRMKARLLLGNASVARKPNWCSRICNDLFVDGGLRLHARTP